MNSANQPPDHLYIYKLYIYVVGQFSIVFQLFAGLFAEEHQKGSPCALPVSLPAEYSAICMPCSAVYWDLSTIEESMWRNKIIIEN